MKNQMRMSQIFPPTLREVPKDASTPGYQLLLKAGYIQQSSNGVYILGPMALRVLTKIEAIVREEMNKIGGTEVNIPILQTKEIWEQSGRWDKYKAARIMFFLQDRNNNEFGLAPTAEELVSLYAKAGLKSYAQLPLNIWQLDWKFRDEIRPRMGLLRCKLFRMKDAYTFDTDQAGMEYSFGLHRRAYARMFERMSFNFISVQADSGAIGGEGSAEFMALSSHGEDVLITCNKCDYGANREKAQSILQAPDYKKTLRKSHVEDTPHIRTVEELERHFKLSPKHMVKTILYIADEEVVAVCCRGDLPINEIKLTNILNATHLEIADQNTVVKTTNAPVGFAGPIGLKKGVRVIYDTSVEPMTNFLCGCNQADKHVLDVNFGWDIPRLNKFFDVHNALPGDVCIVCRKGKLQESRGIEIGHIFMLQQGYAKSMEVAYTDEKGQQRYPWMGCYGLGTTRCLQAIVEQHNDNDGIIWPESVAPFRYTIVPTSWASNSPQRQLAEQIFKSLSQRKEEVVIDDRPDGFGVKIKDALLLGFPQIIVVGRDASKKIVEAQNRSLGRKSNKKVEDL